MAVSSDRMDLVIRGGTVITAGSRYNADIGIKDGTIQQIGGAIEADREIDATGRLVLPGGIDMHVHLTPSYDGAGETRWVDDFATGTRAAAAGGITTIGNMCFPRPDESLLDALQAAREEATPNAYVDYVLHPVLTHTRQAGRAQLREVVDAGHTTLKFFMTFSDFEPSARHYLDAMRIAGELGMLTFIHAEDLSIINHITGHLVSLGTTGADVYPATRPVVSEEAAVVRAIGFAEATGAPIYIAHLSSRPALEACLRARMRGLPVAIETRPTYLHLTADLLQAPDGAKYVSHPPLRDASDVAAIWNGLRTGEIQTLCTDHAPWRLADKLDPAFDITNFRPGVTDLETMLPLFFSEGVDKQRISIHRFVEATATNAARLFGIFPRKGTIAVGSDADLAIWDPALTRTFDSSQFESNADFSPYDGWEVTGWPVTTISRGEVVCQDGEIVAQAGRGQFIPQGPTQML